MRGCAGVAGCFQSSSILSLPAVASGARRLGRPLSSAERAGGRGQGSGVRSQEIGLRERRRERITSGEASHRPPFSSPLSFTERAGVRGQVSGVRGSVYENGRRERITSGENPNRPPLSSPLSFTERAGGRGQGSGDRLTRTDNEWRGFASSTPAAAGSPLSFTEEP